MDLKFKREKLAALKDEVEDFHPVLMHLFEAVPEITKVEYTHGKDEKGADFVLSRQNHILGDVEYIGVIVKVGKIHMDFSDIERQIDECDLPRLISNGKQQIYLHEIWIVSNENITKNAQEKIHHKYHARKIHFIDYERLVQLIDKHIQNYWYEFSIKVGEYLSNVWIQNEDLDKSLNLLSSCNKKIYIEQDIVEVDSDYNASPKNRRPVRPNQNIKIHDEINSKKVILIEGGMGTGKSKLLRQLISYYAQGEVFF